MSIEEKPLGKLIPILKDGKQIGLELTIHPCGEVKPWNFHTGAWCGEADDSVGVSVRGLGCAIKREDVKALRELLEWAEANWSEDPDFESYLRTGGV